jgi:hypothetical protein
VLAHRSEAPVIARAPIRGTGDRSLEAKTARRYLLAAAEDPKMAQRQAERVAIIEDRLVRMAEREAARLKREAEMTEELATAAKREAAAQLEVEKATPLQSCFDTAPSHDG